MGVTVLEKVTKLSERSCKALPLVRRRSRRKRVRRPLRAVRPTALNPSEMLTPGQKTYTILQRSEKGLLRLRMHIPRRLLEREKSTRWKQTFRIRPQPTGE